MDEKWGSWGIIIFLILLFMFFGNGNFFGGYGNKHGGNVTTDDVERRNLISTADTNYRIIEQGNATRQVVEATANTTQAKIDFYAYQGLRDELSKSQMKIAELTNQLFVKDQLAPLASAITDIRCNMLVKPQVTGVGAACPNASIINGLGLTSLNNSCGCGNL